MVDLLLNLSNKIWFNFRREQVILEIFMSYRTAMALYQYETTSELEFAKPFRIFFGQNDKL